MATSSKNIKTRPESKLVRTEIGQRIRERRVFLNMKREDLAKQLGITPTFLTDIELGTKGFSLKTLDLMCTTLKMDPSGILYGANSMETSGVTRILKYLPPDKVEYAEKILLIFISSCNDSHLGMDYNDIDNAAAILAAVTNDEY